jgi:hypothetical protein
MSKNDSFEARDKTGAKTKRMHPIWRGIGFALLILAPFMGFAASTLFLNLNNQNKWFAIPRDLLVPLSDPYLLIKVILTIVFALIIFLIFQIFTFMIYKVAGPSRYGPLDVPPVRFRGKRYKR